MNLMQGLTPGWKPYAAAAAIALVGTAAGFGLARLSPHDAGTGQAPADAGCDDVLYWYDPMAPDQRFDAPGKSPFMDMQLVPKCAADEAKDAAGVRIDPALVQNFAIRTAKAEYGVFAPDTTVTGTLAYNGSEIAIVQPRAAGFVQRTYGHAPQDVIARGAPIADLLMPEWVGAQQEYLAVAATGDAALTRAARGRMRLLGMPDSVITAVTQSGRLHTIMTVTAPQSGAITTLGVRPGMTVAAGQTLAEISGFSTIWLEAAVPEALLGNARIGQVLYAALPAYPGERFAGRIITILPSAQEVSRTITVRAAIPNPDLRLKPGMFARVTLAPEPSEALLVPSEAVIRTGERTLVMIAQGKGRYRPAEVRTGREAKGRTEVLAGLAAGEAVITSGQFLLDSEASLAGIDARGLDERPPAAEHSSSTSSTSSIRRTGQ